MAGITMYVSIRLVHRNDVAAILAISNYYAATTPANFAKEPENLESWLDSFDTTHEYHPWLVAESDDGIIGFTKASPWKGRCAYQYAVEATVYVMPDYFRRGIGHQLYQTLLVYLRQQGYATVIGGITQPNPASVKLHESLGFSRVALFEKIGWKFDRWHDVGYWQLQLRDDSLSPPKAIRPVVDINFNHEQS